MGNDSRQTNFVADPRRATAEQAPRSRTRAIASRGHTPTTPEGLGEIVMAMVMDRIEDNIDSRQMRDTCRGMQTFISLARNVSPVRDLCEGIEMARKEREIDEAARRAEEKKRRKAELEAELATLES